MHLARIACFATVAAAASAQAGVIDLRAYVETNGHPMQTGDEPFVFLGIDETTDVVTVLQPAPHNGNFAYRHLGEPFNVPILAKLVEPGDYPTTEPDGRTANSQSRATFPGLFAHPGYGSDGVVCYQPDTPTSLDGFDFVFEYILDAHLGDGMTVTFETVVDGVTTIVGGLAVPYTDDDVATNLSIDFNGGLTPLVLDEGDSFKVRFNQGGTPHYDHANFNLLLRPTMMPEPTLAGLGGMAGFCLLRRRRAKMRA
jgi:hypothetical protein